MQIRECQVALRFCRGSGVRALGLVLLTLLIFALLQLREMAIMDVNASGGVGTGIGKSPFNVNSQIPHFLPRFCCVEQHSEWMLGDQAAPECFYKLMLTLSVERTRWVWPLQPLPLTQIGTQLGGETLAWNLRPAATGRCTAGTSAWTTHPTRTPQPAKSRCSHLRVCCGRLSVVQQAEVRDMFLERDRASSCSA